MPTHYRTHAQVAEEADEASLFDDSSSSEAASDVDLGPEVVPEDQAEEAASNYNSASEHGVPAGDAGGGDEEEEPERRPAIDAELGSPLASAVEFDEEDAPADIHRSPDQQPGRDLYMPPYNDADDPAYASA